MAAQQLPKITEIIISYLYTSLSALIRFALIKAKRLDLPVPRQTNNGHNKSYHVHCICAYLNFPASISGSKEERLKTRLKICPI